MELAYPRDAAVQLHRRLVDERTTLLASLAATGEEIEAIHQSWDRLDPIPSLPHPELLLDIAFFLRASRRKRVAKYRFHWPIAIRS